MEYARRILRDALDRVDLSFDIALEFAGREVNLHRHSPRG